MTLTGEEFIRSCDDLRKKISGRKVQTPVAMMPLSLPDLPESWCWTSLSSLCERVSVGHVGPTTEFFCDRPAGIPFLRSQDVRPGKLTLANVAHVVQSFHDKLKKSQLKSGDILIVRVGANRGDCCVVPDGVGSLNCANIVFARPLVPNRFLGFFFNSEFGQSLLSSLTTGSAQGVLNTQSIATIPVPVPPINLQRKIASILSAYDDLIENNTRRIAILEEMAQAIYREWFVNFRFPGHENVKLVESTLGKIPDGWQVTALGHIADVNASSIKKDNTPDSINYIDIASVSTGRIDEVRPMPFLDAPGRARRIVRHGDTIWSTVRPNRKSYCVILEPSPNTIASTGFAVLSANAVPFSYLYFAVTTDDFSSYLVNHATGSAYPAVNSKDFFDAEVMLPPEELLDKFHNIVGETLHLGQRLLRKNRNLRTTRDLLLPKLISGQLDVEDLDIDVGMTAEELTEVAAG